MVRHLVLFKLADEAEGLSPEVNALKIKTELEALQKFIPEINKITVDINSQKAVKENFDILLDSEFDDFEALKSYQLHSEHQKIAAYIKPTALLLTTSFSVLNIKFSTIDFRCPLKQKNRVVDMGFFV